MEQINTQIITDLNNTTQALLKVKETLLNIQNSDNRRDAVFAPLIEGDLEQASTYLKEAIKKIAATIVYGNTVRED
jgi:hypothetical protein